MTVERRRVGKERQSVSHVASNFGSGTKITLFHHGLLSYPMVREMDQLVN